MATITKFKCVVVDDDPDWLEIVRRHLSRSSGCLEVVGFSDATQALLFLQGHSADAVVTDLRMPELHGLQLIEAIRRFDESVPVVLISNDESVKDEALAAGASRFLSKAMLRAQLLPMLELLMRCALSERAAPVCPQVLAPPAWSEATRPSAAPSGWHWEQDKLTPV